MNMKQIFTRVLNDEANAIVEASTRVSDDSIKKLLALYERISVLNSNLIFTGIGKSGIIAKKISSTFCSLGLKSFYMHPVEAVHGDMGRICSNDAIVYLSKSGTTEEILKLQKYLPITKENSVCILGNIHSPLAKICDISFDASVEREACLNDLAPTTSTTLTLSIGDAMSVLYEKFSNLSPEKFAKNHPAGFLGKSLSLKINDLMISYENCPRLKATNTLKDAFMKMTENPIGICVVLDENDILDGIIVDGDFRRILGTNQTDFNIKLDQLINKKPITIKSDSLAYDALKLMQNRNSKISSLPIIDDENKFIGIIRLHELFKEGLFIK